ncbi:hypothetical protein CAEBREN_00921 [Caenorhabditis brenneri]|uniref:DUF38 domain-containing protein n=1 Tax=Caenorhabditis brenneri TaxID=135651 RepID=G0P053_CAEBE|nr:hypothetical protein CAEBREN_00921 [Caenorhabditis brenneri]
MLFSRSELKLKGLSINAADASIVNGTALRNMENLFSSMDHQIHAKQFCSFGSLKDQLSLLPYFNPEVLQRLFVYERHESEPFLETLRDLVKLDQWNNLTTLSLNFRYRNPFVFYPVEHFVKYEEIGLNDLIRTINDSPEIFAWIRELIVTSPNIDKITAGFDISFREVCEFLDPDIEIEWDEGHNGFAYWRTPNSTFAIGRHDEDLRQLIIMKENGINWGPLRVLDDL